MAMYRKGLTLYQAAQLPPEEEDASQELLELLYSADVKTDWVGDRDGGLILHNQESGLPSKPVRAEPLDWIVKNDQGFFYRVKPDIFEALYERVEE